MSETSTSTSNMVYRQFVDTCRSEATRSRYVQALHYFMSYLHLQVDAYDKLIENDPKISQMNVCDFVTYLRKRGAAYATISLYVAAINKFYSMNDITLNWKKTCNVHNYHVRYADTFCGLNYPLSLRRTQKKIYFLRIPDSRYPF
jgi:hypothetical protein